MEDEYNQNFLNNDENYNEAKNEIINQDEQNFNEENNNNNEIIISKESNENDNMNEQNENNEQIQINIENEKEKVGEENKPEVKKVKKQIPLYISSAKILEINSVQIPIYFFKGIHVQKKMARSFKDIELYRDYLRKSWPCIYIPNFPLREEAIDENKAIIPEEKKMTILNHFFRQIGEAPYLLECEITQIFTTKPGDYSKEMAAAIKKENYKSIGEKYLNVFNDYIYIRKEIEEKEAFIKSFKTTLEETFKQFSAIGATVLKEMFNLKREQNTIRYISNMFVDLEKAMPNKNKRLEKINEIMNPVCSVSYIICYNFLINFHYFYSWIFLSHI